MLRSLNAFAGRLHVLLWAVVVLAGAARAADLPDFTELAERQGPAVVNISTTQTVRGVRGMPGLDENDPMSEFLRRYFARPPGGAREYENKSLGSGFIIGADGYILTNAHVVEAADEILVRLTDKREFKAKLVGADKRTDVALIKIEAGGLPRVKLGDPSRLRVGEWVIAIGSPFGFDNSVTAGIVSAKGRELPQENLVPFIQTDVAINPGNSGGPLFNMKGEVVGINSQIYSRSGGYMGLSFSIPIDVAMDVQAQLRAAGRVSRGRMGVVIQEVNKDLAESFGLPRAGGALVSSVEKGGPADKAGLQAGDIVLKFDGKAVNASGDLPRIVGATRPGTRVPLQVWRRGSTRDLSLVVAEIPEEKLDARTARRGARPEAPGNALGLGLSELTTQQRQELGIAGGLLVEEVSGAGAHTELRPGDIILALIDKGVTTEVKTVRQLDQLLSRYDKSANATLLVRRGNAQSFVTIRGGNGK